MAVEIESFLLKNPQNMWIFLTAKSDFLKFPYIQRGACQDFTLLTMYTWHTQQGHTFYEFVFNFHMIFIQNCNY